MTIRGRFFGSLALSVFFGCATGGALVVDHVAPQAAIGQDVDEGYFYANLAPHGQWFFQADFGWVWHPARVSAGWRPYTEGQWVWAQDVGWTWASQEPWGWATYHYGRWYFDPTYGWSWVPGRTWAPAWVSWRVEAGFIGWAPLWPAYFDKYPDHRWDRWSHDHDWDRRHNGRDWDRWVFTRDRDFTSDRVGRHAINDRRERDRIFSRSRDVTKYDESRPERIGHSIDRAMVEKATGRPVRSVRIEAADKPDVAFDTKSERIRMFRPAVKPATDKTPDRLGLAREPSREARESNTIRQEKMRLDNIPDGDKARARAARPPVVREKTSERGGGGPASVQPAAAVPGERENARPEKNDERGRKPKADTVSEMNGERGRKPKADTVPQKDDERSRKPAADEASPAMKRTGGHGDAKTEKAPPSSERKQGSAAMPEAERPASAPRAKTRLEGDTAPRAGAAREPAAREKTDEQRRGPAGAEPAKANGGRDDARPDRKDERRPEAKTHESPPSGERRGSRDDAKTQQAAPPAERKGGDGRAEKPKGDRAAPAERVRVKEEPAGKPEAAQHER
jgi:hypothetical protein